MRLSIILIGLGLVLGLPTNVQALDPDVKCNAAKVKETAKYSACLLKAESKAIKKGEVPDFSKCDSKSARSGRRWRARPQERVPRAKMRQRSKLRCSSAWTTSWRRWVLVRVRVKQSAAPAGISVVRGRVAMWPAPILG